MPSKILMGEFKGEKGTSDFNDFLDHISKFVNDKDAEINRDDINVIESSEFDISYIHPSHYTKQGTIIRNEMKAKREQERKLHALDFNEVVKLRQKYPLGCQFFHTEDSLLDAILDDKYPYEYALLHGRCLEKEYNKEKFFARCYPDVMIKIITPGLHQFILVRLNTTKPAKILMGMFGDAAAIGSTFESLLKRAAKSYLEVEFLNHYIGEHKKDFRDFQNNISKFVNGDDINRKNMRVIKYSEFDIKYINPYYYFPLGIEIRNKMTSYVRRFLQNRRDINDDSFDFTEVIRLRMKYPHGAKDVSGEKDALLNAILNNEYTYKYALINIRWLNKNRKQFFNIYHPDVMIRIESGLDHFILVHLNTAKPSKILMGTFEGKIVLDDTSKVLGGMWLADLEVDMLYYYIRKYEGDFCDFLGNISKFINGNNDIDRDDMNIIEYDEFNIYNVSPWNYTKQRMGVKKKIDEKYHKSIKEHGDINGFDFNKIWWLRLRYLYAIPSFDEPKDYLFDAIEDGAYKYEYALLSKKWLKYNREKFFAIYHPDVMISIDSLTEDILVHLNTNIPSKILTGVFKGNAYALDKDPNSKVADPCDHIGEYEEDFCDFQDNILKFINGNNDINRDDMRVIEYDEFDIDHISPYYYSKENIKIDKLVKEYCNRGDIHTFDFNKIVAFRRIYPDPKNLFDAIQNNEYTYKYVLLEKNWLEEHKKMFFARYHPDIIISIDSMLLDQCFIVNLNTTRPTKILTGVFEGNAFALDAILGFDITYLSDYIGERHEENFCDFLDNISKFVNDKNAEINRDDINIIESSEFDIDYIHPIYYTKTKNEMKAKKEQEKRLRAILDFNEVVKLRQKYSLGCWIFHTKDSLLDAILDDKYPYEYALLHGRCLEKNKEKFFARYHPDVMIKIIDPGLHYFILVRLNTTKPAKILMGMFRDARAIGSTFEYSMEQSKKNYLGVNYLNHFIGEHKKDFCDFQDAISKFVNGDDMNRKDDMKVIKYSEFDIKYINPYYYFSDGIYIRNKLPSEMRRFLQNRGSINDDSFDFTEAIRLRMKYPCGAKYASGEEDALLNAILNNEYTYKYALINKRWLEKNRKRFFTIYHPDVMIRIVSPGLDHFILIHLNTAKSSKILTGEFRKKIASDETSTFLVFMWLADLGIDMLSYYIRRHEGDFCDFLGNISKFVNGNNDINRDDMNIIEYDEFDIYSFYPGSYTKQEMRTKKKTDEKYHKFLKKHGDTDGFDFNKIWWLRAKYSYGIPSFDEPKDYLFDAIEDGVYKYEYALLSKDWLEYNKEKFFDIYHPDVMIRIMSFLLSDCILVHLNTSIPSKILTGVFKENAYALDADPNSKVIYFHDHIGEHEKEFCGFQDAISKFINGDNDINRKDMRVIEYDKFDIDHIDPFYYSKENIKINKLQKKYYNSGDIHTFDFNRIVALRGKYQKYLDPKNLFDAIQNNEYTYKYILLEKNWLEENKKMFFAIYHPDIIINIDSMGLDRFFIVNLNTTRPTKILTGIFEGNAFALDAVLGFKIINLYDYIGEHEEDFNDFLDNISRFLNDKNAKINRNDINIIEYDEFKIDDNIHPLYYSKQAIKIRNEIEEKDYKVLTDYVDVIDGPIVKGIRAKCLSSSNFVYPLKYDDIKEEELPKAIKIQKGDITYSADDKDKNFYLYNLDNNDVYIHTKGYKILRCKDEKYTAYIVNYLNNKKMNIYLSVNIMYLEGRAIHSNIDRFDKIKVINPKEYMLYIADETQKFKMYPEKIKLSEMNKIIREAHQIEYEKTFIQIAIDCIIENLHDLKLEALEDIINNDLKELDICHEKGAYKSAVILCGSILEAFLLDWLAEYEEKDDISKVIKIEEFEKEEYLELEKIIDKIEDIIKPYWKEKAEKADNIRDMRNMVHPKKYIKQSNKINKEECKKIIDDLKDIIVTRRFYKR